VIVKCAVGKSDDFDTFETCIYDKENSQPPVPGQRLRKMYAVQLPRRFIVCGWFFLW